LRRIVEFSDAILDRFDSDTKYICGMAIAVVISTVRLIAIDALED
jgi:hypothetical protein